MHRCTAGCDYDLCDECNAAARLVAAAASFGGLLLAEEDHEPILTLPPPLALDFLDILPPHHRAQTSLCGGGFWMTSQNDPAAELAGTAAARARGKRIRTFRSAGKIGKGRGKGGKGWGKGKGKCCFSRGKMAGSGAGSGGGRRGGKPGSRSLGRERGALFDGLSAAWIPEGDSLRARRAAARAAARAAHLAVAAAAEGLLFGDGMGEEGEGGGGPSSSLDGGEFLVVVSDDDEDDD